MECFKRILVGVDLSRCKPMTASSLGATALASVDTAIALAQACEAQLHILTVFNWSRKDLQHLDPEDKSRLQHTFNEEANLVLDALVERAWSRGVDADSQLALGKPWREIIRQVMQGGHDLVVVGAHEAIRLRRFFMGNTALKLLRRCPCPVWICKSAIQNRRANILVASDLGPASESALHHGIMLGRMLGARVHLLHVVKFHNDPLGDGALGGQFAETKQYHQEVLQDAENSMREQLEMTAYRDLGENCEMHLVEDVGDPAYRIERFIASNKIDLLVLGAVARHGLAGLLFGNTAEALLSRANCSLLVAKSADFHCPLRLDPEYFSDWFCEQS